MAAAGEDYVHEKYRIRLGAERLVDVPARRTYSPPPLRLRRYGGAAPRPGSSPIRGVGGLCADAARAAAPHWLRPTIIAIWPARAGEAAGRSAQQCFPCCLLDPTPRFRGLLSIDLYISAAVFPRKGHSIVRPAHNTDDSGGCRIAASHGPWVEWAYPTVF